MHLGGGGVALNFQRGKMTKSLLEIAPLLTFVVCKSITNRFSSRTKIDQAGGSVHAHE